MNSNLPEYATHYYKLWYAYGGVALVLTCYSNGAMEQLTHYMSNKEMYCALVAISGYERYRVKANEEKRS